MALLDGPRSAGEPSLFGMTMKQASLVTLTLQNSVLILIMHYSRIMNPHGDHRYFASTAVFLNEVIKLPISLTFAIYEASQSLAPQTPISVLFEQIYNSVFSGDGWKLAVPAALYTLQNTLQYVALGNLDPVHFQVLYELKILATAVFSVLLLGRTLSARRWFSLVLLTVGVAVVSIPSSSYSPTTAQDTSERFFPRSMHELGHSINGAAEAAVGLATRDVGSGLAKRSATYEGIAEDQELASPMNYSIGLAAVLVAAIMSALTGVYFEKVLKDSASSVSVWTRNVQLSFYSLFPSLLVGVVIKDGADISSYGFFAGYNWVVWTAIVCQAAGGILVSLCINYADNIAKNFATSISIVISFALSFFFFDFEVSFSFLFGTLLVLVSTYLYSEPERKRSRPPPINIVSYEKTTVVENTPRLIHEAKLSLEPPETLRGLGITTSRPSSPMLHQARSPSARGRRLDD